MTAIQTERALEVSSPLGQDVLLLRSMKGQEELGRMFDYRLELLSDDHNIKLEDVLGQSMTITLETPEGDRFYNGIVSEFAYAGIDEDRALYHASVRPWLWLLTRSQDCRIFQKMPIPEIIKQVFRDAGQTDFDDRLTATYESWEYCVQYRETAHDFVCRLMEQEGIYFYFKHEKDNHILVLADSYSAHDTVPGYADIPFYQAENGQPQKRDREHVFDWLLTKQVQPGAFSVKDFDFEMPSADLETKVTSPDDHAHADSEVFDYPAEYKDPAVGETYVRIMQEEHKARHERLEGESNARGVDVGALFSLSGFPRDDQNREYLVVRAHYMLSSDNYGRGAGDGDQLFRCRFEAIESSKPYRSPMITKRPLIQGPQTAIVVGKSGDEISTDKYGRVKLQFHWDRYGTMDENSSCWIRVAQVWAGNGFGAIHIPRIGQEVIVEFLEGDPDRPIITGRVFNAEQMPPYDLPANATQSGIKSKSSKEGSNADFNEIRFEDKAGAEQVYLHAQMDFDTVVKNDQTTDVQNDRSVTVANNDQLTVAMDRVVDVGQNVTRTVGMSETVEAGVSITMTAVGDVTITAPVVTIDAPMVVVSGQLQCAAVVTTSSPAPTVPEPPEMPEIPV
ncbi:MAG: type VI secretion system tip protein TssI/VgrG [Geminicoccaceae bacterium]